MITEKIISIHKFEPFVLGKCKCGCGEKIERIRTAGRLRRFKNYHSSRGKYNPAWNGGIDFDKDGYVLIWKPNHPFKNNRGYVQLHRLIMEKHIGRYLKKEEVVHHINGIQSENLFSNLLLFESNSQHISETLKKDMDNRICLLCGSHKTRLRKIGTGNWCRYLNGFICMDCYMKIRYKKSK